MKSLAIVMAAALALIGLPFSASAQYSAGTTAAPQAPATPIDPHAAKPEKPKSKAALAAQAANDAKAHEKAMADVPPLIAQSGYACTLADATYRGISKKKGEKGKDITTTGYEVACQGGLGYLVFAAEGEPPIFHNCLKLETYAARHPESPPPTCQMAANANQAKALQPAIEKAGEHCTITKGRWIGEDPTVKIDEYELACAEGQAEILQVPQPGSAKGLIADTCLHGSRSGIVCEYYTKDQMLAQLRAWAAPANRAACQISDGRYVGAGSDKSEFYEVGCTDGKSGYVLQTKPNGAFVAAIDCARAGAIAGGCTLTQVTVGSTDENALYTRLSKEIGYACDVKGYRGLGLSPDGREVVELTCNDHPDGAIAFLPADKGQKGEAINCARAEARSLKCNLSPMDASFARITAQLTAKGKECPVNGARGMGSTAAGEDYVEVTCSTGGGLVLNYAAGSDNLKDVLACAQAKGIGGGCKLQK